ncbi:protein CHLORORESPIRATORY REDUCTION 41, chloroplastic-like [Arachis stenosperma]|uniref:protein CHLORORESPIRATORY REDUCTION 41, chloroplastic-like n=1 Tax=Arachis stenosperma TaxID=217475 RepID=UPI0025AD0012|nr:protein CHLORORESPIRATORY REDUCTION 41, chloroplastic-like [Arachis stenosperma]
MASTILQFLSSYPTSHSHHPNQNQNHLYSHRPFIENSNIQIQPRKHFSINCTNNNNNNNALSTNYAASDYSNDDSNEEFPTQDPNSSTVNSPETFPIEKRRRSEIVRQRRPKTEISQAEPPNFEVGWKRTKEINLELPIGYVIADFLEKLEELMGKEFGSTELLAKAGEIVAERAREEAEILMDEGKVEERMVTELFRVLKLMEMDLAMVKASVKEETLDERLKQAKARCRQAILVAYSF